jgi:hypothetical protein
MRTATILLLLSCCQLSIAQQRQASSPSIGCVNAGKLQCGCYIKVKALPCGSQSSGYEPNFFTGLQKTDPLHLQIDGEDLELPHKKHRGKSVKGDSVGAWSDEYVQGQLRVQIDYTPISRACTKPDGDACEYSEYRATVTLRRGTAPKQTLRTSATCGC